MRTFLLSLLILGLRGVTAQENAQYTIDQTIKVARLRPAHGIPWNLYRRANQDAKGKLYELLENKTDEDLHPGAIRVLGYIGSVEDVETLEQIVLRNAGVLRDIDGKKIQAVFDALSLMSRRGVNEAKATVIKFLDPEFWSDKQFKWLPDEIKVLPGNEYESVSRVLHSFALSNDAEIPKLIEMVLGRIKKDELKKYMGWRINPERLRQIGLSFKEAEAAPTK